MVRSSRWADAMRGVTRNSEAAKRFVLALDDSRPPRVAQAHALAEIDGCRHYRYAGSATLGEYGERYGLSGPETRRLAQAGHAMALISGLEDAILGGEVSFESAQALWLTCRPHDPKGGDEAPDPQRPPAKWLELARQISTENFCRLARYDRRRRRLGEPPVDLEFLVSSDLFERFRRAKTIAQHQAKRTLTNEELLALLVKHYLESYDVWAKKGGKRRLPDTRDVNGRYVPVSVRRYVWERDGGRCIHPGCQWDGEMHFGHIIAHRDGGHREGDNLYLVCPLHNEMEREGMVRVIGPAENPRIEWRDRGGMGPCASRPHARQKGLRKARGDLAAHRHLGEPGPEPRDPARDGLNDLDLAAPPCALPSPGGDAADGSRWYRDRRLRVPHVGASRAADTARGDLSELDAWLERFFAAPG